MALEEKMTKQAPKEKEALSDEELDLKIAMLMTERLLEDGGFDVVQSAVDKSSDPSQVIGQFMMQMGQQLMENMPEDITLSPTILLARGGWVEQVSDMIQDRLEVKKSVMDKAEIYVASTAQQMADAAAQKSASGQAPQQEGAAPVPAEAPPAMPMPAGGM